VAAPCVVSNLEFVNGPTLSQKGAKQGGAPRQFCFRRKAHESQLKFASRGWGGLVMVVTKLSVIVGKKVPDWDGGRSLIVVCGLAVVGCRLSAIGHRAGICASQASRGFRSR